MRPETREAMEKLFYAKWNVPKAAKHCNLTDKEIKCVFSEWCGFNPPLYPEGKGEGDYEGLERD